MKCPKCNQEIEDDSVFCEYCGEKIKKQSKVELQEDCERVEQENNQQVLKTSKNKLKIKKWHIITAAGVLFTGVFLAINILFPVSNNLHLDNRHRKITPPYPSLTSQTYTR